MKSADNPERTERIAFDPRGQMYAVSSHGRIFRSIPDPSRMNQPSHTTLWQEVPGPVYEPPAAKEPAA